MAKSKTINVKGFEISISTIQNNDYISLTDMAKAKDENGRSNIIIQNWMRNRNTIEYLGIWEQINNPNFKGIEFDAFKKVAGLNSFVLTPKQWTEKTDAIGIVSKSGNNGGTFAHKDIAFEFGMWISAEFKIYLIREFQRLKEIESNQYNLEWNVKRVLSKVNYEIHTDAVKNYVLPKLSLSQKKEWIYAEEADILNIALFGCTAKQWRDANPNKVLQGENIRDMASINELAILSNIESLNAVLIKNGLDKTKRLNILYKTAQEQKLILDKTDFMKSVKKLDDKTFLKLD